MFVFVASQSEVHVFESSRLAKTFVFFLRSADLNPLSETPLSLIERLKSNSSDAWQEFSELYVRILKRWCSAWGIQPNDADDIVQETLLVIFARVPSFERRGVGSFRAWIKTISWRCWCDVVARADRTKNLQLLESLRGSTVAYESLEADFDRFITEEMLHTSMSIVKRRVEPKTWEAFSLTAMESLPAAEVAQKLGMQTDAVYAARCRVQRWITQEFKRLERLDD